MHRKITIFLDYWKNSKYRKPLILQGARQVGKTYSVLEFGRTHYENTEMCIRDSDYAFLSNSRRYVQLNNRLLEHADAQEMCIRDRLCTEGRKIISEKLEFSSFLLQNIPVASSQPPAPSCGYPGSD